MEDRRVTVIVPTVARTISQDKVDCTVHYENTAGQMAAFLSFVKRQRAAGLEVEVRAGSDKRYPIAEIEGEGYKLTVFGPHFVPQDMEEKETSEPEAETLILGRIAIDAANAELVEGS